MTSYCRYVGPAIAVTAALLSTTPVAHAENTAIAIGPYVYDVTSTSAKIRWATLKPGATPEVTDADAATHDVYDFHEKELKDLKPGTANKYDVLGNGSPEGSGSVTTFPVDPQPFRFIAYGDTRTRSDVHQRVVNRVIAERPLFVLQTGDLVSDGKKLPDWLTFLTINRELMRNTLYLPVLGNHERGGNMFFSLFRGSPNERYKAEKIGDVLFLMLDSEGSNLTIDPDAPQKYFADEKAWVEKTLNDNADVGFVFPYFHKPVISVMRKRQEEAKHQNELWGDIFERHGVQVVLQGHDHHYHHAYRGGTHYVTCAGGGAPLYDVDALQPETVKAVKVEHFDVQPGLQQDVAFALRVGVSNRPGLIHGINVDYRAAEPLFQLPPQGWQQHHRR